MLDKQLQKIQEIGNIYVAVNVVLQFGKLSTGEFALVLDHRGELDKARGGFATFFRFGKPMIIVFKDEKDLRKLATVDSTIDTEVFIGVKAQKLFRGMKVLRKGKASIEIEPGTFILKKVDLIPFKKGSVFVIRLDQFMPSQISKTTNEIPATTYYRIKGNTNIKEMKINKSQGEQVLTAAVTTLVLTLAMMFMMLGIFIASSKRDRKLEKKLNGVLKDGKKWKVYKIKDDSPNAFCIATPRMFIHTGLIKLLSEDELMAVMLHEAGHIKNKDIWKKIAAENAFAALLVVAAYTLPLTAAAQAVFLLLLVLNNLGLQHILLARSLGRMAERRADNAAVKYGYGTHMASALDKLNKWIKYQQKKRPCGKVCKLVTKVGDIIDEHPPLEERVKTVLKQKETWEIKNFKNLPQARQYITKKLRV